MGVIEKLVVKSIQVSSDRKRVFLAIDGLKAGDVIYLSTTNLISQDNKTLWFGKTWYTLNAISTSAPFEAKGIKQVRQNNSNGEFLRLEKLAGKMNVILPSGRAFDVSVVDFVTAKWGSETLTESVMF